MDSLQILTPVKDLREDIPPDFWSLFKQGDSDAFSKIYYTYYSHLFNYGLKLTADQELAEDAIQNLFLKIWKNRENISSVTNMKAYLFKAFRRQLYDDLERKKKKSIFTNLKDNYQEIQFSPEEMVISEQNAEEFNQRLSKALNSLSKRQKEVIYLRFYKGLSYEEIAEVLPMASQTIRNTVHNSIKLLRNIFSIFILFKYL